MKTEYEREKPLKRCPHSACTRGNGVCKKLSFKGQCVKTHFATYDECAQWFADHIIDVNRRFGRPRDPSLPPIDGNEAASMMYKAFRKQVDEHYAEQALLKSDKHVR